MMRLLAILSLCAVLVVCAAASFADDINPPSWRGLPGTTFAEWRFSTSNPVSNPDSYFNPYGVPTAHAWTGTGQTWIDQWGGRQGMWPLSGTIEVTIPNNPVPNPSKEIWVQLTWARQTSNSMPFISELLTQTSGQLVSQVAIGPTGYLGPYDMWYHSTYRILLYPNPVSEIVKIDGTVVVDQLVIDTICIPEPGTCVALAVGLFSLAGFARRRHG